jgi:DnaK suppressor protein
MDRSPHSCRAVALVPQRPARYTTRGPKGPFLTVLRATGNVDFGPEMPTHPEFQTASPRMTQAELKGYRQRLLALRDRLSGDVSHLAREALRTAGGEASGGLSNMPLHPADLGTDNFEQEFTFNLLHNQEQVLGEIADALERIQKRRFGLCEECHQPIPAARLEALPYARHCVACARKIQQGA